jgi:hypothetical protein
MAILFATNTSGYRTSTTVTESEVTAPKWQNHKHLIQECQLSDIMTKGKEKNNHFHFGDNHIVSGSIMMTDSEGQ